MSMCPRVRDTQWPSSRVQSYGGMTGAASRTCSEGRPASGVVVVGSPVSRDSDAHVIASGLLPGCLR
jgi:hypothetical protein